MQNPLYYDETSIQSINTTISQSQKSSEMRRIPCKGFHRTSWKYFKHPCFKKAGTLPEDPNISFHVSDEKTAKTKTQTKRWIISKKIVRLHNWKNMHAPFSMAIGLDALKNSQFAFNQNPFKIKQLTLAFFLSSHGHRCAKIHDIEIILYYLTRQQTEIQNFILSVRGFQGITEKRVNFVRKIILTKLPQLKNLEWDQWGVGSADAKIVSSQMTRRMASLKSLFLNFGMMAGKDFSTVPCVGRDIGNNMPNLQKFVLYFWEYSCLNAENVKSFAEGICRKLVNLKHLHLNFRNCKSFDSECLKVLSDEIIRNLINLRLLILIIDGCSKIRMTDLDELPNKLSSSLLNLRYLFYNTNYDAINILDKRQTRKGKGKQNLF